MVRARFSAWALSCSDICPSAAPRPWTVPDGATTGADWGTIGFSGTNSTNGGTSTLPGNWEITTGTTTTGNATLYLSKTVLNPTAFGSAHIVTSTLLHLPNLSVGTNTFTSQFALIPSPSSTTLAVNNSVGIRYSHGINSGKFEGFSRDNGGTESTIDSGRATHIVFHPGHARAWFNAVTTSIKSDSFTNESNMLCF